MHELSIAMQVVETLTEDLVDECGKVSVVRLRVGSLSGVVPDALRFAWDVACRDTRLDGAMLEIDEILARIWCEHCRREQAVPNNVSLRCPVCSEPNTTLVAGCELEILSVELNENEPTEAH